MSGSNPYMSKIEAELTHMTPGYRRALRDTISCFRDVTSFLVHVAADHHEDAVAWTGKESVTKMDRLVHATSGNPDPEYPLFDKLFYKYPSYYRRSAIHTAVGHVSSHETRCDMYYDYRDELVARGVHYRKMEPAFTYTPNACPTLYDKECCKAGWGEVRIKARIRNTWDWISVCPPRRDAKRLMRAVIDGGMILNPKLVYKFHKFYLQFPVRWPKASWDKLPLEGQKVMGLDRGVGHGGVFSVVDASGTVCGRGFDPFRADMDRITHVINLIRKASRESGRGQRLSSLYTKLDGLKRNYVRQLARWVADRAEEHGVYGVVIENLSGVKGRRGIGARVHHWVTSEFQRLLRGMCARLGIRVFVVNPRNTSRLAFDGSGPVKRGREAGFKRYSVCRFATGKTYNCDLNASYNIAARYFLREYQKSIPAKEWSALRAKVPGLSKRTSWTLATLREMSLCARPEKACAA